MLVRETSLMRDFNFSAGPAVLPVAVLERAQSELLCLPVPELRRRRLTQQAVHGDSRIRQAESQKIAGYPGWIPNHLFAGRFAVTVFDDSHELVARPAGPADYLLTGAWGKAAYAEAVKEGEVRVPWDGKACHYDRVPANSEYAIGKDSAYVYFTSNETIEGVQFQMSLLQAWCLWFAMPPRTSCIDRWISRVYGLLYACAQKNAGPAGVTIVIIRDDLVQRGAKSLPGYLSFQQHVDGDSMYNTPPTFAIYLVDLVAQWLLNDVGGLDAMYQLNREKSKLLYDVIDASNGFYRGHAQPDSRSVMNVTFRVPSDELEAVRQRSRSVATYQSQRPSQRRRFSCFGVQRHASLKASWHCAVTSCRISRRHG